MLYDPFSSSTLIVGWLEGPLSSKKPNSANPSDSVLEQVEEEDRRGNWVTCVHLEKRLLIESKFNNSMCCPYVQ